ncbi:MAG: U32 family peptidase [Clostridia bacterium]|nr:U32 family peptidase [Clostridia bacterium]
MKILSPAGNLECLKVAVFNGADEVYIGINDFNARNNIDGFNLKNIKEGIDFAHLFGCKINLAINILFTDEELNQALNVIVDTYNKGVDSFIIQDLALAKIIHSAYPEIEIHASTQMGIHNLEGVKEIEKYGFKRVVLARETPLEEIKRIRQNSKVEIEYFAQGALCVSLSGNCYLSSYLLNASGNRGKCKQLCRLPYTLLKNNKPLSCGYLLSAKDFNMINQLKKLKDAGVDVLKIEGRARRPFYVGATTREYYNALNNLKINHENIKLAFNREYTNGYFDGNGKIISVYNNHIGINIGVVQKVITGKKFNEVYFSSKRKLFPKSTFKLFDKTKEVSTITAFDLRQNGKNGYVLTTTQKVKQGELVNLIIDANQEENILSISKKKVFSADIFAEENKQLKAIVNLDGKNIEILGEACQKAISSPISQKDFELSFEKNNLLECKLNFVKFDNIFITKQKLNEFRRIVYQTVFDFITKRFERNLPYISTKTNYVPIKFKNFKVIDNVNQEFDTENIIFSPEQYVLEEIELFVEKCKKLNKQAFLDTPNFATKEDIALLKTIIEKTKISIIANNYYALSFNTNIVIGGGLNVYNTFSAEIYNKPIISAESNIGEQHTFPVMTLRHCPFKNLLGANCNNCPYSNEYSYKLESGQKLLLKRKKLSSCTFYLHLDNN